MSGISFSSERVSRHLPLHGPIAVIAPSHAYDPEKLARGLHICREWGLDLHLFDGLLQPDGPYAAPAPVRLEHLRRALSDTHWSAVWMARGGSGMSGLIPQLRASELRRVPVIGFSDTTPLLTWLTDQGLGPAIHGPVLNSLASTEASDQEALRRLLCEGVPSDLPGETWFPGEVRAPVIAGNLCMLAAHCGTPSQVSARGRILVLEEVGEPAYRVLRMMDQLRQAGVLDGVLGIGLGEFTGCEAPAGAGWTLADRLRDWLLPLGVPVVAGLPVGHGARNRPVVLGAVGRLG